MPNLFHKDELGRRCILELLTARSRYSAMRAWATSSSGDFDMTVCSFDWMRITYVSNDEPLRRACASEGMRIFRR